MSSIKVKQRRFGSIRACADNMFNDCLVCANPNIYHDSTVLTAVEHLFE